MSLGENHEGKNNYEATSKHAKRTTAKVCRTTLPQQSTYLLCSSIPKNKKKTNLGINLQRPKEVTKPRLEPFLRGEKGKDLL